MYHGFIVPIGFPIFLSVIMFGLGLNLTTQDFLKFKTEPKAVIASLLIFTIVCPILAFLLALVFQVPPEVAIGLMIVASAPSGTTANIISHLSKGDVALNITTTAMTSLISIFTLPVCVYFSFQFFMGAGQSISPPVVKIAQMMALALIPMAIGMIVRRKNLGFALKFEKVTGKLSGLFLIIIFVTGTISEYSKLTDTTLLSLAALLTFCLASLLAPFLMAKSLKIPKHQSVSIAVASGNHNNILAITIAASPELLNNMQIAIPAMIHSALALGVALVASNIFRKLSTTTVAFEQKKAS